MSNLTLTVDGNANQKLLRRLESKGFVELHALNMESMISNKKMNRKDMPLAVLDSPHSTLDNCVIAANDTIYSNVSNVMTKDNHGDAMQLEGHIRSGRDVFVTDDRDFLDRRDALKGQFGVEVKSTKEIAEMFNGSSD
ncbi:MAG: hypothetical protein ABJE00_06535 [Erythrobacter sp.]